jgi:hypothetical protein
VAAILFAKFDSTAGVRENLAALEER